MQELDDIGLLREYVERGSEAAFAALVERHINKVYSVAWRHTGNPHQAEEITQAVFVILARKARQLSRGVILYSWLYKTARLAAAAFIRGEVRRARREQEACMANLNETSESEVWPQIAPLLDAALAALNETDRRALVLRFFYGKTMKEIGADLGANEDATKKRVDRALDKLQNYFSRRGIRSTTTLLAGTLSACSVQVAPATLAKSVTAVALAKGAPASTSTLTLIKGALKIMAWTKAKTAVVTAAVVILAAGTTTPIIIHHLQAKDSVFSWKRELSDADNAAYQRETGMTPEQAAKSLLEASASEDRQKVAMFFPPGDSTVDRHMGYYGGLKIISLGKAFKGRFRSDREVYGGVLVPYEIRLKNGEIHKWQLAIECSNPEHHWYFDGGM